MHYRPDVLVLGSADIVPTLDNIDNSIGYKLLLIRPQC